MIRPFSLAKLNAAAPTLTRVLPRPASTRRRSSYLHDCSARLRNPVAYTTHIQFRSHTTRSPSSGSSGSDQDVGHRSSVLVLVPFLVSSKFRYMMHVICLTILPDLAVIVLVSLPPSTIRHRTVHPVSGERTSSRPLKNYIEGGAYCLILLQCSFFYMYSP